VKLRVALLALLTALAAGVVGSSQATVSTITVNLGNLTSSSEAKSGTTLYYAASGSNSGSFDVTVTASSSSAVTSVDFPSITGMTGGGTVAAPGPYVMTYSWTATTTATGAQTVTVHDSDPSSKTATFTVAPDVPTVKMTPPTEVTGAGDQYWDATTKTQWFRPTASGSFTLNATVTDQVSTGGAKVSFPDVSTTAGWAGSTGGDDTASPFSSPTAYSWTSGAGAPGAKTVTATTLGGPASDGFTISGDAAAPSGQAVNLTGGPWFAGPVPLTLVPGTDTGSGVDASRAVLERASAALTNGVCGTFGTFAAVTPSSGSDTSVASGNCYRYQYKVTDNVGNASATSPPSADAKIDKTPPTTPSLFFSGFSNTASSGAVVYFRPGGNGTFTVTAASSDPESGIASYVFPTIPGFTAAGSGPHRTYAFTNAGSVPTTPFSISSTNGAGVVSGVASFTLVPDSTAPTLTVRCNGAACGKQVYPKTVTVTLSATDTTSGVDTVRWTSDGTDPTVSHGNEYLKGISVQGLTHLKIRAFDNAGNATPLINLTVNSRANRLDFGGPAALVVAPKARFVSLKVTSSLRANVRLTMTGTGLKKPARWYFILDSGTSVVRLRLPAAVKHPGTYRLVWSLSSGTQTRTKAMRLTLRA